MPAITQLPLDLKGTMLSNRITDESRTLVRVDNNPHRILLPRFGAFYHDENFKLYDGITKLLPGIDYTTTYLYRDLSKLTPAPLYAFIVIINPSVSNTVTLSYQAVGGHFALNVEEVAALLAAIDPANFSVSYEDIIDKPAGFNPAPHMDQYWSLYGAEHTVTVLQRVRDLLAKNDEAIIQELQDYSDQYHAMARARLDQEKELLRAHLADTSNPHADDKIKIGLSEIQNWRMVLLSESLNTTLDMYYSTPEAGLNAINSTLIPDFNVHISDQTNPHGIRAQDVGSYTATEITTFVNGRLHKQAPASNSAKIFGYTRAGWKTYCNTGIPAGNITTGLFKDAALGTGTASVNTVLMGNGTWKSWLTLIQEMDAVINRKKILYVRSSIAGYNTTTAINYLNANFGNVDIYPVGSKAVFMGYRVVTAASTWNLPEVKFLIRTSGGWAAWLV